VTIGVDELERLLRSSEGACLEFKEAKNQLDSGELVRYCAALANEGGGKLVLGVTNKRPRQVVGSRAFTPLSGTVKLLLDRLRLRIDAYEVEHPDGRVVVFDVPSRPRRQGRLHARSRPRPRRKQGADL
jgi:ATP-dependent DNA helicase RecG